MGRIRDILHPQVEPRGLTGLSQETLRAITVEGHDGDHYVPQGRMAEIAVAMAFDEMSRTSNGDDLTDTQVSEVAKELATRAALRVLTLGQALGGALPWDMYGIKPEYVDQTVAAMTDRKEVDA